jgi:hypothetical protein
MAKNKYKVKRHKEGRTKDNQIEAERKRKEQARKSEYKLDFRPPNCFLCKQPMVPVKDCKPVKCGNKTVDFTVLKCFNCWPSQFPKNFKFPIFKENASHRRKGRYEFNASKKQDSWDIIDEAHWFNF